VGNFCDFVAAVAGSCWIVVVRVTWENSISDFVRLAAVAVVWVGPMVDFWRLLAKADLVCDTQRLCTSPDDAMSSQSASMAGWCGGARCVVGSS